MLINVGLTHPLLVPNVHAHQGFPRATPLFELALETSTDYLVHMIQTKLNMLYKLVAH
jgi:hypothetical protein